MRNGCLSIEVVLKKMLREEERRRSKRPLELAAKEENVHAWVQHEK